MEVYSYANAHSLSLIRNSSDLMIMWRTRANFHSYNPF